MLIPPPYPSEWMEDTGHFEETDLPELPLEIQQRIRQVAVSTMNNERFLIAVGAASFASARLGVLIPTNTWRIAQSRIKYQIESQEEITLYSFHPTFSPPNEEDAMRSFFSDFDLY